jgi:serine/threonine-protein kinase
MIGVDHIGRYQVLRHLASGGMGQVYLARSTGLGGFERKVVVKTLEPDPGDEDSLVPMFLDEARLLGALHHQYIAPIYEVGRDEDGRYFLVMDYVRGETAEAVWRASTDRGEPIPLACSLSVVSAVASALDYAHGLCGADGTPLAIVHRDVSLSNVMIGDDGAVKLIDFGIAKFKSRTACTQVGSLKGKLGYLSPEQILQRRPVDHRADLFALGVVLYELTTLHRAFREGSELVTLERIINGDVAPPSHVVADYPPELEAIVMRLLAVDPDARFSSAGDLERALAAFAVERRLQLGHRAIIQTMSQLFEDRPRRFARSSGEIPPIEPAVAPDDATAVEPVEAPEDTAPVAAPEAAASTEPADDTAPLEVLDIPTTPLDGLVPRSKRPTTVTAQIARPRPPQSVEPPLVVANGARRLHWYLFTAVLVVVVAVGAAIAYR